MDPDEVIAVADELIELVEDDLPGDVYNRKPEFFDSVLTKAKSIKVTIEERNRATSGQFQALSNMLSGVKKWMR